MSIDVFEDAEALEADLFAQESLLWARSTFSNRIVEASSSLEETVVEQLRIEAMYHFAEFFYLLKARGIRDVATLAALADAHNRHLDRLSRDAGKMRRLGLTKTRLLEAIFTSDTLPRLIALWREHPGQLDQSNLARFLATVMSTETCRKLVVASSSAGFLTRAKSVHGPVLAFSTGVMEQVFGGVVRDMRMRILAFDQRRSSA